MEPEQEPDDNKELGYELFIAAISVLSIFNFVLAPIPGIDPDAVRVVIIINAFLTILFILDFIYRTATARSRSYYFFRNWGWADLLACVPVLRFLRLFRIFRAYRLLRKNGSRIIPYLSHHRAESALYLLVFSVIVILEGGAFLVLSFESVAPDANITSASDALWWAYVTITTVGYGDRFPVTNGGRLVGILIMTTGVGIFATFAGFIANKLLAQDEKPAESTGKGTGSSETELIAGINDIHLQITRQEETMQELRSRLENLENLIRAGR